MLRRKFMTTLVSGAGWIVPKKYVEPVGDEASRSIPSASGRTSS